MNELRPLDQQQVQQSQQQTQLYGVANVRVIGNTTIRQRTMSANLSNTSFSNINPNVVGNILPQHISRTYYTHSVPPHSPYFNDGIHSVQVEADTFLMVQLLFIENYLIHLSI